MTKKKALFVSCVSVLLICWFTFTDHQNLNSDKPIAELALANAQADYTIDLLHYLSRTLKKSPRRFSTQLIQVNNIQLSIKLLATHYLLERHINPQVSYPGMSKVLNSNNGLTYEEITDQTAALISKVTELYRLNNIELPSKITNTHVNNKNRKGVSSSELYRKLLVIESVLYGFNRPLKPIDVYQTALETRSWLQAVCGLPANMEQIDIKPKVTGKSPKDVYKQLFSYLEEIAVEDNLHQVKRRPGHILPQDLFDASLIALANTKTVNQQKKIEPQNYLDFKTLHQMIAKEGNDNQRATKPITPADVYQVVSDNRMIKSRCITL